VVGTLAITLAIRSGQIFADDSPGQHGRLSLGFCRQGRQLDRGVDVTSSAIVGSQGKLDPLIAVGNLFERRILPFEIGNPGQQVGLGITELIQR